MKRYWCWWLHRYLLLIEEKNGKYIFEDFGDCRFELTKEEFDKLERR